jgi:hypothetical protein
MRNLIIFIGILLSLASCKTYTDFEYCGTERVEYKDTIYLAPIHLHFQDNTKPECVWIEEFSVPYTQVLYIENWVPVKRRLIKVNSKNK